MVLSTTVTNVLESQKGDTKCRLKKNSTCTTHERDDKHGTIKNINDQKRLGTRQFSIITDQKRLTRQFSSITDQKGLGTRRFSLIVRERVRRGKGVNLIRPDILIGQRQLETTPRYHHTWYVPVILCC